MRNILTVFLASPSDLYEERRKTFAIVEDINATLRKLEWSIELLGWEDTLPGFGRPQSLINRDVERCDLFIGMLWRRWGTVPGSNPRFSSGFEEEFVLAKRRREAGPLPEMWMFFKSVEPESLADPGDQLKRVISFRDSLIANKEFLFVDFTDINALEQMLRRYLYLHVFGLMKPKSGAPERQLDVDSPVLEGITDNTDPAGARAAGRQIAEVAGGLAPVFESGSLSDITRALDAERLTFMAVRSFLLSAALVAESGSSRSPFPIHEINTLYRFREQLSATSAERRILFRVLMDDGENRKPGWYWFRDDDTESVIESVEAIVLFDDGVTARTKGLEILRRAGVSIFARGLEEEWKAALRNLPSLVQDSAWAYLVAITKPNDFEVLQRWGAGTWLETRLNWLNTWIKAGCDLNRFLSANPDPLLIPDWMERTILSSVSQLSEGALRIVWSMPLRRGTGAAFAELRSRGLLNQDEVDHSPVVSTFPSLSRSLGLSAVVKDDETDYERLRLKDANVLAQSMNWFNVDGATAYRLVVERGLISKETARNDIATDFRRVRAESERRIEEMFGPELAVGHFQVFEKHKEFLIHRYREAALLAFARNPTAEDAEIARHFIRDRRYQAIAVRILESVGASSDVIDLIDIATSVFGPERDMALKAVLSLTADKLETARTLLRNGGTEMVRTALELLRAANDNESFEMLLEMLLNQNDDVRLSALAQLRERLDHDGWLKLLRVYIKQNEYYYDVATWLDRLAYAPEPIAGFFGDEFARRLSPD